MRVQETMYRQAIHHTLRRAHQEMNEIKDSKMRSIAEARWQGIILGLLLAFPVPDVEKFIIESMD